MNLVPGVGVAHSWEEREQPDQHVVTEGDNGFRQAWSGREGSVPLQQC